MNITKKIMKLAALSAVLMLTCAAQAVEVAGVPVAEHQQASGQELVLNGAGLRSIAFFKVYVASLYVPKKTSTAAALLDSPAPSRMVLRIMRNIDADQLIKALREGIADNVSETELATLQAPMEQLSAIMRKIGSSKEGDTVTLDFKGESVTTGFNGAAIGVVSAPRFGRALLSIWLGEKPVDASLKKALLGA
jgi:long-chain acyl-CoA synthetase